MQIMLTEKLITNQVEIYTLFFMCLMIYFIEHKDGVR